MKPMGELVTAPAMKYSQPAAPAHSETKERLNDVLLDRLFIRLGAIYGKVWTSRFASAEIMQATKREWGYAIGNCSGDDLAAALRRALERNKLPPTLPEFLDLLRGDRSAAPYHRRFPIGLPRPRAADAIVDENLRAIRSALGRAKNKNDP